MPLPKLIHVVWIGDETKRPDRWIKTWRRLNPTYEVRVWGNDAVRAESWMLGEQINAWVDREINGAADIIRWEILFKYGGLAFDADSACVRPIEDWLIESEAFAAWEQELLRPGLIAAGALGFKPQNYLVANIMKDIVEDPDPLGGMAWQKLGPQRITDTYRRLGYADLTVFPSHFFFPRHHSGLEYTGSGPVFARQFWGSTHRGWGTQNQDAVDFDAETPRPDQAAMPAIPAPAAPARTEPAPARSEHTTPMRRVSRGIAQNFYLQKLPVADVGSRLPYIRGLCAGKKVLHVGCTDFPVFDAANNLHIQIRDVCRELDGLDTDRAGMDILAGHVPGRYFASVAEVDQSYDLMLVPETIEHVADIRTFLGELDSIDVREILITAPCLIGWAGCFNYRDVPGRRASLLSEADDYIEEIHPDHKAWFTPYTLANCVEQFTGWQIDDVLFVEQKRMTAVRCTRKSRSELRAA